VHPPVRTSASAKSMLALQTLQNAPAPTVRPTAAAPAPVRVRIAENERSFVCFRCGAPAKELWLTRYCPVCE
jgi:hypothetical protein